jgi:glutathione S-transferase
MVQLSTGDIRNREILNWQGLHIFHGRMSSCSQKLRIFLNFKGIDWEGHELNLSENETYSDWFLGINPRGLVPVLVQDGNVHIESNDIITLLEQAYPEPCLIPPDRTDDITRLLEQVDSGGTINGALEDESRDKELQFYQRLADEGLSDDMARAAALRFQTAFDIFEDNLARGPYLLGDTITIIDIAWFVYASRLDFGAYPFARLHPNVNAWRQRLADDDRFAREIRPPNGLQAMIDINQQKWTRDGTTMSDIVDFG